MKPNPASALRSPQLTALNDERHRHTPTTPPSELPRERLLTRGPKSLSPVELLAVILNTGRGRSCDVIALAHEVLQQLGGVGRLCTATAEELTQIKGIGPVKASRLIAGFELARRGGAPSEPPEEAGETCAEQALIERALRCTAQVDDGAQITLLAYPSATALLSPEELITLSLDQSLCALDEERDGQQLSQVWLRRLLAQGERAWRLIARYHHAPQPSERTLEDERGALDVFTQRARLIGLTIESYLLIQGQRYAQLTPSYLMESCVDLDGGAR